MLDAILKSKFYCRCKSEIKLTIKRIEIIKRKRNAMQKFLRNDVADLLKTGLDSTAYSRVEQLYADQILSSCYEFVEQSCLQILNHLSSMNKQRECPEECKDAIPTLMYSAARFADLPELRELRTLFAERYGNHLELYVNQEFVKNLKADPLTKEIKLQMMREIATDCGINWNSKTLEQNLYEPPPVVQDYYQHVNGKNHESLKAHHQNSLETKIEETENKTNNKQTEIAKKNHILKTGLPYKPRVEIDKKQERPKDPPVGNGLPYKSRAEIETKNQEKHDHDRTSPCWSSNTSSSSETITSPEYSTGPDDSASEDLPEEKKFHAFRATGPPYIKPESTKKSTVSDTASSSGREVDNHNLKIDINIPEGRKYYGLRSMGPPYIKTDLVKKSTNPDEEKLSENINKPVPRSMRNRKPLKPVAGPSRGNNEVEKPSPNISNGENLNLDYDHNHEDYEEKKMDKLLSHYSKKSTQLPVPRTGSLPTEPLNIRVESEGRKGLTRAATYQPDSDLSHVHPKLPDYDDFVARLAAFRASS